MKSKKQIEVERRVMKFLKDKPDTMSKKKFAELIGADNIGTGYSVIYFNWEHTQVRTIDKVK